MSQSFRRTRIVATLGPGSSTPDMIGKLIETGVDVFRLNFSHGKHEVHQQNVTTIRSLSEQAGRPIGILQDLQGPKIRTATFADGKTQLIPGQAFNLTCDDASPGDNNRVGVTYTSLCEDVKPDDLLLLDDGRLSLRITGIKGRTIHTEVVLGGTLSNNKGINIPGADLSIPALTEKDVEDLNFGATLDVDWVAMSFVRNRDDLVLARHYLNRAGSRARLMAKIEKPAAVKNFAEILESVDGIMVARGDLGVELSAEKVPLVQKRLIRAARAAGKPVVTATQMLESMIESPTPTRAEASDVANAIHDGTDAVMLSGETAVGKYPLEAVSMMARIARQMEADDEAQLGLHEKHPAPDDTTAEAVALAACQLAYNLSAKAIVCFTSSGSTAIQVSRNRFPVPIIAVTPNLLVYRQMALVWGTKPVHSEQISSTEEMVEVAHQVIKESGFAARGDRYVITGGVPFGMRGTTNMIRVARVGD